MSLSGALSNALSGLTVSSRMAEVVSSNVSNAATEGYGRRTLEITQRVVAGVPSGAQVGGIARHVDPALLADRRLADAELGRFSTTADFLAEIERAIGSPDDPASLTARIAAFGGSLIEAASRPDLEARLEVAVAAGRGIADHLNTVSDRIQGERERADTSIAAAVEHINTSLEQLADLNGKILRTERHSQDAATLLDHRQRLIDGISELVPVRELVRDNGTVALFTTGGAILLDGLPAELGFSGAGVITPHMSLAGGTLSGLTINGKPVATGLDSGPISGGKLAALFDVRDVQAPAVQARLDAVARDLVERFQDPAVDPTLGPGDAGLFTDAGAAFLPADEVGLAGRIALNPLADPDSGGAAWRIRDGLGAASPGAAGNATLITALSDALTANRVPASGGFSAAHSATGLASDLLSGISASLHGAETRQTYARGQAEALTEMELRNGVDTDQEMQRLLLVEQIFAANARVVSTVDELIQSLLRI